MQTLCTTRAIHNHTINIILIINCIIQYIILLITFLLSFHPCTTVSVYLSINLFPHRNKTPSSKQCIKLKLNNILFNFTRVIFHNYFLLLFFLFSVVPYLLIFQHTSLYLYLFIIYVYLYVCLFLYCIHI